MGLIFLYIEKMMGYMIVALPIYIVGRIIYIKKKQKQVNVLHEVLLSIFVLYIVGLASQTIIPYWSFVFLTDTKKLFFDIYLSNENATVNLIPFNTLFQYFFHPNANVGQWGSVSLLNLTANIILFTPIGFLYR